MLNEIAISILILIITILYSRYITKYNTDTDLDEYNKIKNYLLNDSSISNKSIIWIHLPYKYNSRQWKSFYSRTSNNLNLPYIFLTVNSILKHNSNYHICLIDDDSYNNLIPGWTIKLSLVPEPIKQHVRLLATLNLLYTYGGISVPSSFLCFKNFNELFNSCKYNEQPFICQNINRSINTKLNFVPDPTLIGSNKNSEILEEFIKMMEIIISKDFTHNSYINGEIQQWCQKKANEGAIHLLTPKEIGIQSNNNKIIELDNWFEKNYIKLADNAYGIYIPHNELIKRTNYNWFCYLMPEQIYKVDNILAKYFVLYSK